MSELKDIPMQKVLLDCGTQHQQGLNSMIEKLDVDESWIVHSFEANPHTYNAEIEKRIPWVNYHNLAVACADTEVVMHCEREFGCDNPGTGGGSTMMPLENWRTEKRYGENPSYDKVRVQGFDLSKWITTTVNSGKWGIPEIYIKMDIEGAEIFVLDKMLGDGLLQTVIEQEGRPPFLVVEKLFVEFHFDLVVNVDVSTQTQRIVQYFFKHKDQLEIWW